MSGVFLVINYQSLYLAVVGARDAARGAGELPLLEEGLTLSKIWHTYLSQGLGFQVKILTHFKSFPLRSAAVTFFYTLVTGPRRSLSLISYLAVVGARDAARRAGELPLFKEGLPSTLLQAPHHLHLVHRQFENNYFTEMCSGSAAGSYSRLIDPTLGLRVIKKKRRGSTRRASTS